MPDQNQRGASGGGPVASPQDDRAMGQRQPWSMNGGQSGGGNSAGQQSPYGPSMGMSPPGGLGGMEQRPQLGHGLSYNQTSQNQRWGQGPDGGYWDSNPQQRGNPVDFLRNFQSRLQDTSNPLYGGPNGPNAANFGNPQQQPQYGGNQYGRGNAFGQQPQQPQWGGGFGQNSPYGMPQGGGFSNGRQRAGGGGWLQPVNQNFGQPRQMMQQGGGYGGGGFGGNFFGGSPHTMRGSLPSFGSLGGGPFAFQNIAQQFPQFNQPRSAPQYGQHFPRWNNDWAMDANGMGVPLPAGMPRNMSVTEWNAQNQPPPVDPELPWVPDDTNQNGP